MAPGRVVPPLDEIEDGHPSLGHGPEPATIEQLALERREEALAHRVVVAVPDRSHGGSDPCLPAALAEFDRRVLASLVRVMDHVVRAAPLERHVQGVQNELRPKVVGHRPPDDPAPEDVHDSRKEENPRPGRDVRLSRAKAPCGLTAAGFFRPPAEPDVHLSLCIRLSRNQGEVGCPHPSAAKTPNGEQRHEELLPTAV